MKSIQLVGFKVGREFFGLDIASVREIVRVPDITQVPETPDFVEGVINLRGRIVPVIDLRKRLGVGGSEKKRENRVLIAENGGRMVGLVVDSASEVMRMDSESIKPPPDIITNLGVDYITGVADFQDRLIILLDLSKILDVKTMVQLQKAGSKAGSPAKESEPALAAAGAGSKKK